MVSAVLCKLGDLTMLRTKVGKILHKVKAAIQFENSLAINKLHT